MIVEKWLSEFKAEPGLNDNLLNLVQASLSGKSSFERNAILSFDEVDVKNVYQYDKRSNKIYGGVKKMQVVMARGLFSPWKQVIFYDFQANMTKELLDALIIKCEEHGLKVRGVAFDLGNHTFLKDMGIMKYDQIEEKFYFLNPFDNSRKVYLFPDCPHMIKLLRNHCIDYGILIPDGDDFVSLGKHDFERLLLSDREELKL